MLVLKIIFGLTFLAIGMIQPFRLSDLAFNARYTIYSPEFLLFIKPKIGNYSLNRRATIEMSLHEP